MEDVLNQLTQYEENSAILIEQMNCKSPSQQASKAFKADLDFTMGEYIPWLSLWEAWLGILRLQIITKWTC